MNLFERFAYGYGRTKGHYQKGLADAFSTSGPRPTADDDSAFLDLERWGVALTGDNKPSTKRDFIQAFQSYVYIGVKLNAQTFASVPLRLYIAKQSRGQKYKTIETKPVSKDMIKHLYSNSGLDSYLTKAEEIEEVTDHQWLKLMEEVNPYQNKRDLLEMTMTFLDLTGEAYWFLLPDNFKVPSQIYVIPSQYMNPKFGKSLDKAIEYYEYKSGSAEARIDPEHIIYFTYPNPNNIFTGFSSIKGIADAVYIQQQMDAFETALFENRARLGGVFIQTENISKQDKDRMKEDFKQGHEGAKKAGKHLWLPKGLDYKRDTMTPEELNFIEGRRINMEIICLALDIPPGALTSKDVNLANAQISDYRHAKNGILPRCRRVEEKINERLISRYNERLFCAFDNPVPEDKEFKLKENTEYLKVGAVSRDEIRSDIGKDPKGGAADDLMVDSRLIPITSEPTEEEVRELARRAKERLKEILG